MAWGTDGEPPGGLAWRCGCRDGPAPLPGLLAGPTPWGLPAAPLACWPLAGSSESRGPGATLAGYREREARLYPSRQIFTSKAFPSTWQAWSFKY